MSPRITATLPSPSREHVVEVTPRAGAVGRPVGRRGADRAEVLRGLRQQRCLQQTDVLQQFAALALQSPRAQRPPATSACQAQAQSDSNSPSRNRTGRGTTSAIVVIVVTSGELRTVRQRMRGAPPWRPRVAPRRGAFVPEPTAPAPDSARDEDAAGCPVMR